MKEKAEEQILDVAIPGSGVITQSGTREESKDADSEDENEAESDIPNEGQDEDGALIELEES